MLASTLLAIVLAPQGTSTAPVVINEFSYDDASTDDREFVELYNRSGAAIDISGWVLDSEDPSGPNTARTIPAGTVLPAGGRWTIGADLVNPGNVNQVVGTTNLWENDNESLTLRDTNGRIVDTLVYESVRGIWNATLAEGPAGVRAQFFTPDVRQYSWQRCPDGNDNDDNSRDFMIMPATPAAPNYATDNTPFISVFASGSPGDVISDFTGSFVDPRIIDPTSVGPLLGTNNINPNAIPPSPTGDNCAIFWDPSGGGDASFFNNVCVKDVLFRCCAYIDGKLAPTANGETWNIGVRGTVGGFAHHVDPTGTFYASIGGTWLPGNTGVAACWQRSDSFNRLFLIDYGDGSGPLSVLGSIDIVAGINDGWQVFELRVVGTLARLRWGSQQISGSVGAASDGGIYVGYREFFVDNSLLRPPTLDDLGIIEIASSITMLGHGTPNSMTTPTLAYDGVPTLGQSSEVVGMGVVGGNVFLGLGLIRPASLPLPSPWFPPNSALWVEILDAQSARAQGPFVSFPQSIPSNPSLAGALIGYQMLQLDPALSYAIPLSHSEALAATLSAQ
jgi:hypothetical protein